METAIYTTPIPEELRCTICAQAPVQPRLCPTCWQLSCQSCPAGTCCTQVTEVSPHGQGPLGQRLAALPCRCPVDGCQWAGVRGAYLAHYQGCQSGVEECPFGCGVTVHLLHDRWHPLTCSGYQAYLDDLQDTDPVKAALALKLERRLRIPFVVHREPVQLPAVDARWMVMTRMVTANHHPSCTLETAEPKEQLYCGLTRPPRGRMCYYFYTRADSAPESRLLRSDQGVRVSYETSIQ